MLDEKKESRSKNSQPNNDDIWRPLLNCNLSAADADNDDDSITDTNTTTTNIKYDFYFVHAL